MMKRRTVLLSVALLIAGCGGGGGGETASDWQGSDVTTDSPSGSVATVQIAPTPGTAFISKRTHFRLTWAAPNTPPPTFRVELSRYKEARGGEPRVIETQETDVTKISSGVYEVRRRNDNALDVSGVYVLNVRAATESVSATYIISSDL